MISKEEFFRRLKERNPEKNTLDGLVKAGERVMQGAEKLKGQTITLKLPDDPTVDSIVAYVMGIEKELSRLGILTRAKGGSVFPPYGLFPDVENYLGWQSHASEQLLRREYFYDLIAGRRYDPTGRKLAVRQTANTNSEILREVIELCDGEIVGPLEEADTAVYLGQRFCDTDNTGYRPLYDEILPWIKGNKSKSALVLYSATDGLCGPPEEPELAVLTSLSSERENILFMVLGNRYKGAMFLT